MSDQNQNTSVYNSTGNIKRILLAKPTYHEILPVSDVARDLHDKGVQQDMETKLKQHGELESVFREIGVGISWISQLVPHLHWQMFTRDFGVNTPNGALIGRFRYHERKGEEIYAQQTLIEQGEIVLPHAIVRGCMEGGDCYWLDENTLIIGNGNRSTYSGFENAREIMTEYGKRVFVVEFLSKWNHLDMIFQPIADKLAVVCQDAVPDYLIGILDALGWKLIRVPGEYAMRCEINVVALGGDRVLSFKGNRLNEVFQSHGLKVYDPEYSYFTSAGGGPHCSTFELEREP
jgi:N-dimethylarginine dimethylaminohydrolase